MSDVLHMHSAASQGTPPIILGDGSNLKCGVTWPRFQSRKSHAKGTSGNQSPVNDRLVQSKTLCAIPALVQHSVSLNFFKLLFSSKIFDLSDPDWRGLGSTHTLGVSLVSAAIGGMCSTWVKFSDVVAGARSLRILIDLFEGTIIKLKAQHCVWLVLLCKKLMLFVQTAQKYVESFLAAA